MAMTSAQRQANFRRVLKDAGMRTLTAHAYQKDYGQIMNVLRQLIENPDLEIAMLRNTKTGRFQKV